MRLFRDLIVDPLVAIKEAKRKKDLNKIFYVLIINSILFALGFAILIYPLTPNALAFSLLILILNIFSVILLGFFVQLVFSVLGGRGKFYEGFVPVTYAEFPPSFGFFVSSIFFSIPAIGLLITLFLMLVFSLIGFSVFYRAVKEFFGVDLITVWIGISIIMLALIVAIYSTAFLVALTKPEFLIALLTK
jgi:hypothetical protein